MIRYAVPILLLFIGPSSRGDVTVTSVSPAANALSHGPSVSISATFSEPIDPAGLTAETLTVFGLWSGVHRGETSLADEGRRVVFTPDQPFSAGERVTVSFAGSLTSTGGTPLDHGYAWQFYVGTSPGTLAPVETVHIPVRRKGEDRVQTYGAYAGDFNEDGFTDLTVPNELSNDVRLFLNDGTGFYRPFDVYPIPSGSRPSVNEGADFDLDGHMDYVVGNSTGSTIGLFRGDGTGALEAWGTFSVGTGVRGLAVLDLNGDNHPDVVTANRRESVVSTLLNDGSGTFLPAVTFDTPASGETAAVAADMNEDGIIDAVVGANFSKEIVVLLGDGEGTLTFHERFPAGGAVWMIVAGDVNGDGHADVVSANSDDETVSVLLGDGNGGLGSPVSYPSGALAIAIDLGDLDGDGDLDMVSSNFGNSTFENGAGSWVIYENDGNANFSRRTTFESLGAGSCVALHDRNNDGTLDMTAIDEIEDELVLFTNHSVATSTEPSAASERAFSLEAYPNPMGRAGVVSYFLRTPSRTVIELFDVLGRRVGRLFDGNEEAGPHRLPLDSDAFGLSEGVYFVVLSAGGRRSTLEIRKVR